MSAILSLKYSDSIGLDADVLEALYDQLGPFSADTIVSGAVEELAVRLSDIAPLYRAGRMTDLARLAQSMVAISTQIGLRTLARVAEDVCHCATAEDGTALAATLCRLERIGDRSLTAIWDLQDITV
ncbi:hypothetical protein [Tropicimonas isoalkanivorans]|uniref:hypothetical protein n=1 Tax=Tropicimonas isoalkanivorans TaxID=441112 RepID=UPI000B808AA4|nr:hypothetical protein [Tropicimonas isoalkanivorans]